MYVLVPSAAKKTGLRCRERGRAGRPDHRGRQWAPSQMGQAGAEAGLGVVVASPGLTSACSSPAGLSLPWTVPELSPEAPSPSPATHRQRGPRPLSWYVVGPGWQPGGLGPLSAHLFPWCGQNQEPATGPLGLLQGRLLKAWSSSSCTSPQLPREGTGQGSTWE